MFRVSLFIGGVISFLFGILIFLVGIGAIAGIAGGLFTLIVGSLISVVGIYAIADYFFAHPKNKIRSKMANIIDLVKLNDTWVVENE